LTTLKIHRKPKRTENYAMYLLDPADFMAEKEIATGGSDDTIFMPNYEYNLMGLSRMEGPINLDILDEVRNIEKWMNVAANHALGCVCKKAQRGAAVVKGDEFLCAAYNGPPFDEPCCPCLRTDIKDNTRFELCYGVHAEERAVRMALSYAGNIEGSRLYYVKTRDGEVIPSNDVACTHCSRIILDSGVSEVVMWVKDSRLKTKLGTGLSRDSEEAYKAKIASGDGIMTAHFIIYTASKFNELALQYVKNKSLATNP